MFAPRIEGPVKGFITGEQEGSFTTFAVPFKSRAEIQGVHFMDDEAFVVLSVSTRGILFNQTLNWKCAAGHNLLLLLAAC